MSYKFWSKNSKIIDTKLTPDLGLRSWNDLDIHERGRIWKHLKFHFDESDSAPYLVYRTVFKLNELHKYHAYGRNLLERGDVKDAQLDFYQLITGSESDENVALQLISIFGWFILEENIPDFVKFADHLNDVFKQFGLNVLLTKEGFMPRQELYITEKIYEPVIELLSSSDWEKTNTELRMAFNGFKKSTPEGYSECVTHSISTLESFLQQITAQNATFDPLIKDAIKRKLIPNDEFSKYMSDNLASVLARARMDFGNAHPKKTYPTAEQSLMVMNLVISLMQYFMTAKNN